MMSWFQKLSKRAVYGIFGGLTTLIAFVLVTQFLVLSPLEIVLISLLSIAAIVLIVFWSTAPTTNPVLDVKQQGVLLRSVLENIGDGVVVVNNERKFIHFNQVAGNMLDMYPGRKAGEWAPDFSVCLEDKVTPFPKDRLPIIRALRGESVSEEVVFMANKRRPNGFFASVSARPLPDSDGTIQGAVAVFRDIDIYRKREDDLKTSNENLGRKVEERGQELKKTEVQVQQLQKMDAIGRLAGGVAHDFNNILGALNMYCDLMLDNVNNPDLIRENVQEIKLASDRGSSLTRQLLVFSRKQVAQLQVLDLNGVIQQILKMLGRLIGENYRIQLELSMEPVFVKMDPTQIEQIILNLVINARDSMSEGGNIGIRTAQEKIESQASHSGLTINAGTYAVLEISDQGTGMEPKIQSQIFEPFFTTKPVGKGTGLGLTTTYGIVKHSQGSIEIDSQVGRGTKFKIYLPVSVEAGIAAEVQETKVFTKPDVATTILIVEDEDKLRNLFAQALKGQGFKVLMAMDGIEAMSILEKTKVQLVLTDVIMPVMSGIELARYIRSNHPSIRVLLMSGYTDENVEALINGQEESFEFLEKPFNTKQLMSKVRMALGS